MEPVKEAGSQDDADVGGSEPERTSERRRPSRLLIVSAALALGAIVSGVTVLSRADTSVRVPDLVGKSADPVGDNLVFAADTAGLAADVVNVTDCRVRDTNVVVKQTPAPGTRVSAGTPVTVYVCRTPDPKPLGDVSPSPSAAPILLGNLPEAGVVVGSGHRVTFADLEGTTVAILHGFQVAGNPGSPGVWLQRGRNYFLLDVDQGALVPVSAGEARVVLYDEGKEPQLAPPTQGGQDGEPVGHWRYAYGSPWGVTLAQWSGECEAPTAYWIDESGTPRIVTGERSVTHAPESLALGWSPDQRAVIFLPQGACGGSGNPPGIYLYSAPGVGRLIFETEPASSADMWVRLN
jgi:PASTA domain